MRKLILIPSMVLLLGLVTAIPAFAFSPDPDTKGDPDCFGKMASGQAKDHGGYNNVSEDHGMGSVKNATAAGRGYCEG